MKYLSLISIRTRLLVVYATLILVGFGGFALIAGEQISSGAQVDYGQRLQNEVVLVAQGLAPVVHQSLNGEIDQTVLDAALQNYETQVGGTLTLYPPTEDAIYANDHGEVRDLVELKAALQGQTTLTQRSNAAGVETFYTAAPILYDQKLLALLQLSVPAQMLQQVVAERWLELALVFAVVAGIAIVAAFVLAHSIVRPLDRLRQSALHLSQGDFSRRIDESGKDEISELAQTFNEMARQIERMLEEQRAFASNASHELRTPLTIIRQRAEALHNDRTLDESLSNRYVEQIEAEAIRLGDLVEELTLLSRFDSGHAELGHEQVDMLRVAASVQQQMTAQANDKHIQISLAAPKEPIVINARLDHLTVVFRNLLDNAIKYTPKEGVIAWSIEPDEHGMRSQIRDSGIGIDTQQFPHLFERFYRADKAHSRAIPGTGLGLALVKTIVEAYGGHVSIESAGINQGTTVSIFWPYAPQH